LAEYNII